MRWFGNVALFFLINLLMGTSLVMAYDISGTVSYPGGTAHRVYISAYPSSVSRLLQVSIPSIGAGGIAPFTIRGATAGTYTLIAYADTTGTGSPHAFDPQSGLTYVSVFTANVTGANITLTKLSSVLPITPDVPLIEPGNNSVVASLSMTYAAGGEAADAYTLYWSTDPMVSPSHTTGGGSKTVATIGDDIEMLVSGLTNGKTLYFVVTAKIGAQESAPSRVFGPVTVGAPTGGNSVSGTISYAGASTGGTLIVGVYNSSKLYYTVYTNPMFPLNFTVSGVPNGTYQVNPVMDITGDGVGDIRPITSRLPRLTVNSAPVSGVSVTLPASDAEAIVTTAYTQVWGSYDTYLKVYPYRKKPVTLTLTGGPGVTGPVDILVDVTNALSSGTTRPTVGAAWNLAVTYADGTTANFTAPVTGVVDGVATPVAPTGTITSTTPTFTWTTPTLAPAGSFEYRMFVGGSSASWTPPPIDGTKSTVPYNFDGSGLSTLPAGSYSWLLRTYDQYGNYSQLDNYPSTSFTIQNATPPVDGTLTATPGTAQVALAWSGFSDAGGITGYNLVYATNSVPASCNAGTQIYSGTATGFAHAGLTSGTTYYYRLCAVNTAGIVSAGAAAVTTTLVPSVSIITTVAGNGIAGFAGDGGVATLAALSSPYAVAVDGLGNLYIGDPSNNRIRKVDAKGYITTVAGNGIAGFSGDGGLAAAASLSWPSGIAVDGTGNLYIADSSNNRIRKVDAKGYITTVAGNGIAGFSGDGGLATLASLSGPSGISVDGTGNLYIADSSNFRIRKVDEKGYITTVAGNGIKGESGDGGLATAASFGQLSGVAVDSVSNLYITDIFRIRKVNSNGYISTVAGGGSSNADTIPATTAVLSSPAGVALDKAGNLYIADLYNNRIREVNVSTGIITTVAGTGAEGYTGDNGPPTQAAIWHPRGVTLDSSGNLYIADTYNNRIRKVTGLSNVTPPVGVTISGNAGIASASVTLTGAASQTTTSNANGAYSFSALANGSYTVTPTRTGYMFSPASQTVTVNGANVTVPAFSVTDTALPIISSFTLPATYGGLTVPVTLTASDNSGSVSYYLSESATIPAIGASGWSANLPTTFTFASRGAHTLYVWVMDAAGNLSARSSATVTIGYYQVTPSAGANGTISPTTVQTVTSGNGASFTITPVSGYQAVIPIGGTCPQGKLSGTSYTTGAITADCTVAPTFTLIPDATAPTGIVINNISNYYGNIPVSAGISVSLTLFASDNIGVTGYYLSSSEIQPSPVAAGWTSITPTQNYSATNSYTLTSGDGFKIFYLWYKDAAGNVSTRSTVFCYLDTIPPVNGILTATAGTAQTALSWSGISDATSGISGYKLVYATGSVPATCSAGTQLYSGTATSYTHTGLTNSTTYFYRLCAMDNAGNSSTGATASASPYAPDTTAPTGVISIFSSTNTSVTLFLAADDAVGITGYYLSTEATRPTAGAVGWTAVKVSTKYEWFIPYNLTVGDGVKTFYAWYRDAAGNVSATASTSIVIDTTPPVDGVLTATPGNDQIVLAWSGSSDTGSGISTYNLVYADSPPASCSAGAQLYSGPATAFTHTGLKFGATYSYRLCAVDKAGNSSVGVSVSATPLPAIVSATISGSGGGTVNSITAGVPFACASGTCTGNFSGGTPLTLRASPNGSSLFTVWSGDCTGSGDCPLTLTANKTVTATFTAAPRAKIGVVPYGTLAAAYKDASVSGFTTILTLDMLLSESLKVDTPLIIIGGHNATYTGRTGKPTILNGTLTVGTGALTVDGVAVR